MICIIQARTNSQRLPKKVLKKIGNVSILQRLINSLKKIKKIKKFVIATTKNKGDLKIIQISKKRGAKQENLGLIGQQKMSMDLCNPYLYPVL